MTTRTFVATSAELSEGSDDRSLLGGHRRLKSAIIDGNSAARNGFMMDEPTLDEMRDRQCEHGRLNIDSIDRRGHGFTRCRLPCGHASEHTMADGMREFHARQGSDLGPWQTDAEAKNLANEIRDLRGEPHVDYDGEIDPDVKKMLFGHDVEARPGEAVAVGQTASLEDAVAMLHGIGKN